MMYTAKLGPERWSKKEIIVEISPNIPGTSRKEDQVDTILQGLALELINQKYPRDQWIHAYTAESAIDAI